MIVEVHVTDMSERGVQVRVGDGAPFWLPRGAPGVEWDGMPEVGDVVWVRIPSWLAAKHQQLQSLRYQRSMSFADAGGLDPEKAKGPLPMAYDNNLTGVLFKNNKRESERHPLYKGNCDRRSQVLDLSMAEEVRADWRDLHVACLHAGRGPARYASAAAAAERQRLRRRAPRRAPAPAGRRVDVRPRGFGNSILKETAASMTTRSATQGISVAATKKKRGRPRAFGWLDEVPEAAIMKACLTHGKSRRAALHTFYAMEAAAAIRVNGREPNPRYAWFDGPKMRLGVMTELGRVAVAFGHEAARVLADVLARDLAAEPDLKPTTRMVERWLRRERLSLLRQAREQSS